VSKKVIEHLEKRRRWAISNVTINLQGIEGAIADIRKSLSAGPDSRWSQNHDILRWAQSIHKDIYHLAILGNLLDELKPTRRKGKKK